MQDGYAPLACERARVARYQAARSVLARQERDYYSNLHDSERPRGLPTNADHPIANAPR